MAGFSKAQAAQAALKMSMYGPPGSGKSFTALLIAEGLARLSGRRIAYVDTERGTDFYCQAVPTRDCHPEAFDFDALYSRSLTEILAAVLALRPEEHAVLVLDSMTHLWDAAKASYTGKRTPSGGIPMHAWERIKRPYKQLMHWCINSPLHVLILGRQGNEFTEDEDGDTKAVGFKMKAEGETAYEPHICLRLEPIKGRGKGAEKRLIVPAAFVEKDRTGVLQGQLIEWPCFENLALPLLGLLGETQAQQASDEETAVQDSEALARGERDRARASATALEEFKARLTLARTVGAVEGIGREITEEVKRRLSPPHLADLRKTYAAALLRAKQAAAADQVADQVTATVGANGAAH